MIKRLQLAVTAVLLSALAVYGFAQRSERQTREEDSRIALERHDARVIRALSLNAKQKADFDALKAKVKSESGKLAGMANGRVERGQQINSDFHAGMNRIFTAAQYQKYNEMWAPVDLTGGRAPMASGTPFGGQDEVIVAYLKPTSAQWAQYREFLRETEVKLQQYRDLFKQDPNKGAWFGHDLNRWTRSEMHRILGEDKYYEWVRLWDQLMSPYLANGAKHVGSTRAAAGRTAGGSGTFAGKTGG